MREQVDKAKTEAREAVELLGQARALMVKEDVMRAAMGNASTQQFMVRKRDQLCWRTGTCAPTR